MTHRTGTFELMHAKILNALDSSKALSLQKWPQALLLPCLPALCLKMMQKSLSFKAACSSQDLSPSLSWPEPTTRGKSEHDPAGGAVLVREEVDE